MKKVLIVLISVFVPFFIFAQEIESQTSENSANVENVVESSVVDSVDDVVENENEPAVVESENVSETDETTESDVGVSVESEEESDVEAEETALDERALAEAAALEKYNLAKEETDKKIEEIKAFYLEKFRSAADKAETALAELNQQTDIRAEMDKLRLVEEELYAARRSEEEAQELESRKTSAAFVMNVKTPELSQKVGPEELMLAAETIKGSIWDLRENVRQRSEAFNAQKDAETAAKVDEITNAPYVEGETDTSGEPTRTALQRRSNRCDEARANAEMEKQTYLDQLKAEIAPAEKQYFTELAAAYRNVEAGRYYTNSFTDDVIFRVGNFNGEYGYWHVTITSGLFQHIGILEMEFDLTYEEVTGKEFVKPDLLTDEEFTDFINTVTMYDYLFRTNANYISAKVYFTMYKWRETNEYRFTPSKLEIIKAGDTPKVIHKESRIMAKPFIFYGAPVHEVRSEEDIKKDVKRAAKIVEREQKKAGTFNPAYSYDGSNTKDLVQQKGRGAVVISGTAFIPSGDSESDIQTSLNSLGVEATFGLGKYGFIGADFGIKVPFIREQIMDFGLVGGVNYKLGKFVRPYVKGTANVSTTYNAILRAGAGVDFTISIFLLNIGYDYEWSFDYNNRMVNDSVPCTQLHRISAGFGVAF